MMEDIIIDDLSVAYPSEQGLTRVLRNVNFRLVSGKITALVGESGSGKSIMGSAIMGLLDESAVVTGKIYLKNQNLMAQSEAEWNMTRGTRIGWIAQDPITAMDPMQRVGKQVVESNCYRNKTSYSAEKAKGIEQLKRFGLPNAEAVYDKYPGELSGGMAQRVLAAMMAMPHPGWIIADEPTKGLDAFVRREICQLFRDLRDESGVSILFITHDIRLAEKLADYIGIMYAGEILEYGTCEEVFKEPKHPYTISFLEAQPRYRLKSIPGLPPDLHNIPNGCIFKNRCKYYELDICEKDQVMKNLSSSHQVRCEWSK